MEHADSHAGHRHSLISRGISYFLDKMTTSNKDPEPLGPGNLELSDVTLDYGCSEWKSSSQRAVDLYNTGVRLWEKNDLRDIENQLARSTYLERFTVRRIDGSLAYIQNPNYGVITPIWIPYVEFRDYWRLVKEQPKDPPGTYHCSYLLKWRNHTLLDFRGFTNHPELRFQETKLSWDVSVSCKLLREHIETHLGASKVTKIVCFGIGDICRERPEWMMRKNESIEQNSETKMSEEDLRIVQHSIAITLADICRKSTGNTIQLLAQDPDYTVQSQKILVEHGFQIVGQFGAGGFSEIDKDSIVFSPFASAPVKQIIADIARPTLVICDGFGAFNDHEKPWADADSPRTKAMWQEYRGYDFPVSSDDVQLKGSTLHTLRLHWRTGAVSKQ